jgi:transposase
MFMRRSILDDAVWRIIEPLLLKPKRRRRVHPGITHRQALTGILFVLRGEGWLRASQRAW